MGGLISLLRPGCFGRSGFRGETQVSKARPWATTNFSLWKSPSPLCHLDRSEPGFPTSRCWRRPRVRLSLKRAACRSSKPRVSTGNPGERSGEISVWMLSLGNVFRHIPASYIFAGSAIAPTLGFLRLKNSSNDFKMTYNTGMKIKFRTVDNNIPPTTVVPTERRPRAPAPVAK